MGSKLLKMLLALALLLYLVFLIVARVPATWGVWALHNNVPGVRLTGVSGTIWEGGAVGGTLAVGDQLVPIEEVRWEINPWSLLSLRACGQVSGQVWRQLASGDICYSASGVTSARDVQLSAPMSLLGEQFGVDLGGLASLQVQNLRFADQRFQALDGNFSWRDARWTDGQRWYPMGAFAARLSASEEGGVRAEVFDLDGPFSVQLDGHFVIGQEPRIQGTVTPQPEAPQPIRAAIEFIGQRQGDGSFRLAWPLGT